MAYPKQIDGLSEMVDLGIFLFLDIPYIRQIKEGQEKQDSGLLGRLRGSSMLGSVLSLNIHSATSYPTYPAFDIRRQVLLSSLRQILYISSLFYLQQLNYFWNFLINWICHSNVWLSDNLYAGLNLRVGSTTRGACELIKQKNSSFLRVEE